MRALIITPAYSHAHHDLHAAIAASGLPWCALYEHSDLVRCRSVLLSKGIEVGAERLILVDADVIPTAGALEALATSDEVTASRAVFGLYPQRGGQRWQVSVGDAPGAERAIAAGGTFPILWGGLGLCAIHRESLLRIGETLPAITEDGATWLPYCLPFVRDGVYHAEDRALCQRLLDTGTELRADARLRAGHASLQIARSLC